jgi:hypothetical protein
METDSGEYNGTFNRFNNITKKINTLSSMSGSIETRFHHPYILKIIAFQTELSKEYVRL